MASTIKMRRSAVPGKVPTTSQLELGELAVNTHDGKMFFKRNINGTETIVDATPPPLSSQDVFNRVKGLDGAGSGLDADLLDGKHGADFAQISGATFSGVVTAPNFVSSSDVRMKSDIAEIPDALEKVKRLTGATFLMNDRTGRQMGLIAQDVEAVAPEAVFEVDDLLRVAYGSLVGLLVEAIKELSSEFEKFKEDAR